MSPADDDEVRPDEADDEASEPEETPAGAEEAASDDDTDEPDEDASEEAPTPARARRGRLSLYALAFALIIVSAVLLALSARKFLDTSLLGASAVVSGIAIALAILSVVLPGRRRPDPDA